MVQRPAQPGATSHFSACPCSCRWPHAAITAAAGLIAIIMVLLAAKGIREPNAEACFPRLTADKALAGGIAQCPVTACATRLSGSEWCFAIPTDTQPAPCSSRHSARAAENVFPLCAQLRPTWKHPPTQTMPMPRNSVRCCRARSLPLIHPSVVLTAGMSRVTARRPICSTSSRH